MREQSVGIVAECICDLPPGYLHKHGVGLVYFLIRTNRGEFTDTDEVTSENILEYMENEGKKALSSPPHISSYEKVFKTTLEKYENAVFISTGAKTSGSYSTATEAVKNLGEDGKRVHIIDSFHLSTGLGHIVMKAVEMAEDGYTATEIVAELLEYRNRISTTFIAKNADYLYINGRASRGIKKICDMFNIHPVLTMKEGAIALKSVMFGNYDRASLRYVRNELKHAGSIDRTRIFLTHAGCKKKMLERIKEEINLMCRPDELIVTNASATVSSNCGPGTFGVLFVKRSQKSKGA